MEIPHLLRHLAWNLIGPHWVLIRLLPEAEVEASEDEGEGNAEPHAEEGQHGSEGDSSWGVLTPNEEIEEEPHAKYYAGIQHGSLVSVWVEEQERMGGAGKDEKRVGNKGVGMTRL